MAYDRRTAARAAGIAAVALAVAAVVTVATDEGAPWSLRLGMLAALAPVAGTLGTLGAAGVAAGRGELRALAALGVHPRRATAGAVAGGAALGIVGPLAAALGAGDLAALFPRAAEAHRWIADGGGLREITRGLRMSGDGVLSVEAAHRTAAGGLPAGASAYAMAVLALAAIVCPLWAVAEGSAGRRAAVGAGAIGAAVAAFQAVAAGRLPPWVLPAPLAVLLIDLATRREV